MAILPLSLLLLSFSIISPSLVHSAYAIKPYKGIGQITPDTGIIWSLSRRSACILLPTPNLPLYTWSSRTESWNINHDPTTGIIIKISLSHDNKTLIFGHETPFLPLPQPLEPPRLSAPQVRDKTPDSLLPLYYDGSVDDFPTLELDYERVVTPRDDPSIRIWNNWPVVHFNVLGVGFSGSPREKNILLDSPAQKMMTVKLRDRNSPTTNPPNPNYEIEDVRIVPRRPGYVNPVPRTAVVCGRWSWRCEDFGAAPWYRYIWRQDFDESGRVGSWRHWVVSRWRYLNERFGPAFVVGAILVASSLGAAVLGFWGCALVMSLSKYVRERGRQPVEEEEGEGLLAADDEEPPPPYVEVLERPLPPLPADNGLPKYEDSTGAV